MIWMFRKSSVTVFSTQIHQSQHFLCEDKYNNHELELSFPIRFVGNDECVEG